jgi:RimJ/RimL family protein N-acetyltransferase
MQPAADLDLGAGLRLRTLTPRDADLVVEATRAELGRALWGPYPAGAYALQDARAALDAWDPDAGGQVSYGMLDHDHLLGALGLMPDGPDSAELAYWVRPESRRQGLALRGVNALTSWAHRDAGLARIWLEIDPENAPSLRLAERAGYRFEQRIADHCRSWTVPDPEHDTWHDCLIWSHAGPTASLVD